MCPTPIGRVHTRVATIVLGPAVLGLIITLITGHLDWIVLVGVYLLMGTVLDTVVYPLVLKYQPPWMTFVLALAEYGLLLAITQLLEGFPNILSRVGWRVPPRGVVAASGAGGVAGAGLWGRCAPSRQADRRGLRRARPAAPAATRAVGSPRGAEGASA